MRNFRAKHLPIKADRTWQIFSPYNIFQFLDAHVSASRKSGRTATHNPDNAKQSLVAATRLSAIVLMFTGLHCFYEDDDVGSSRSQTSTGSRILDGKESSETHH